jgi:hypothetical protein
LLAIQEHLLIARPLFISVLAGTLAAYATSVSGCAPQPDTNLFLVGIGRRLHLAAIIRDLECSQLMGSYAGPTWRTRHQLPLFGLMSFHQ